MKTSLLLLTFCKVIFNDESLNCSVLETSATESSAVDFSFGLTLFMSVKILESCQ